MRALKERPLGRVVVGVDDSLAGLRALREAVDLARDRGMQLRAVRTYRLVSQASWLDIGPVPGFVPAPPEADPAPKRAAAAVVAHAFEDAMGGVPRDVTVRVVLGTGPLNRALTAEACQEADLLVVAAPGHRLRWWPHQRSVAR